ncbi:MAG: glycosyltransferase 2 family protein, partial [Solirubrobacteraceae bacterium]|nr:glycosyltransferase 2 family protein [Solirubrobacteraceae bacterium]
RLTWWPLAPALIAAVAWWLLLARGWALLATGRAERPDIAQWCRTQVLRYLPGGFWAPVSRATVLRGSALDRVSTVLAENVIAVCTAVAVGGLGLAASGRPAWALTVAALAGPGLALRVLGDRTRLAPDRTRRAMGNDIVAFLAYAGAAVAVQSAVSGLSHPLAVAGGAAIAWAAGLVVIIAPGGLGVRELVYVAVLSSTLPADDLTAGALTMRVVMIAAELAVLVVVGVPRGTRASASEPYA